MPTLAMNHYTAHLSTLLLERYQNAAARLQLPRAALPRPGQYLQTHNPADAETVLATQVFASSHEQFMDAGDRAVELAIAGPIPPDWLPGTRLSLRGPLGRGFKMPEGTRHLALAAIGRNPGRLLPLVAEAAEVALFCDEPVGELPSHIEVQPLAALPAGLAWAEFVAMDVPSTQIEDLPKLLDIHEQAPKTLRGQALVTPPMPCGGLAHCGVCSFAAPRKSLLACGSGPVFALADLLPQT